MRGSVARLARMLLLGSLVCLVVSPVAAEVTKEDIQRAGAYFGLGINVGSAFELDSEADNPNPGTDVDVDPSFGNHIYAGYSFGSLDGLIPGVELGQWAPSIGGQMRFDYLGNFDLVENPGTEFARQRIWVLTWDAKLMAPSFANAQPYALVGVGIMSADTRGDTTDDRDRGATIRVGGGIDVYLTKHIALALGISYLHPVESNIEDFKHVAGDIGLAFHF